MHFQKKPWTVTLKRLAMNFEPILREVALGRVVKIRLPKLPGAMLTPMSLRQKVAFKDRPSKLTLLSHKPTRRW